MQENKQERQFDQQKYYRKQADFSYLSRHKIQIIKQIGRGGYGVVYKAKDKVFKNFVYACKINFGTVSREIIYSQIAFLQIINGEKHLPSLKNVIIEQELVHIFIKYFEHKPFITIFNSFELTNVKHYLLQLLLGLKNLKKLGIYHRDIKPGNFLYNPQRKKGIIVDFGLAQLDQQKFKVMHAKAAQLKKRILSNQQEMDKLDAQTIEFGQKFAYYQGIYASAQTTGHNKIGTESYMPLESLLHHEQQSYSSDIWPVGVIMLQFLLRKYTIFNQMSLPHCSNQIQRPFLPINIMQLCIFFGKEAVIDQCLRLGYELQVPEEIDKVNFKDIVKMCGYNEIVEDLLLKLLDLNYKTRISVEDAIQHSFFDEVRADHQ